jgi:hypothetical protein
MLRVVVMFCVFWSAAPAMGQAYCAMRDPVTGIFKAFPEADSYKSITRTVRPDLRRRIASRLPFTLHINELGRHTVYLALDDGAPLGMLHVRSERGRYGLVEIGWVLDLGMHVRDVYFQRCRDGKATAALKALRPRLQGKSLSNLIAMWADVDNAEDRMLLESAIKTIAVTSDAWGDALLPYQAPPVAARVFGAGSIVTPRALDTSGMDDVDGLDLQHASAWSVTDGAGALRGVLVRLDWTVQTHPLDLWWAINADGTMRALVRSTGKADATCDMLFDQLEGRGHAGLEQRATAAGVIAGDLLDAVGPITDGAP